MPMPAKKPSQCKLDQLPVAGGPPIKTVSLFEQRRLRGFWPCYSDETGQRKLAVRGYFWSYLFFHCLSGASFA